ncbi:hypothetical protein ACFW1F_07610 [Streptomyces bungoensis]|uniref:hypothetical protein n=1 Tax=Streptomyces bungoensis TaxID=285568 RepID=UPI0036AF05AA
MAERYDGNQINFASTTFHGTNIQTGWNVGEERIDRKPILGTLLAVCTAGAAFGLFLISSGMKDGKTSSSDAFSSATLGIVSVSSVVALSFAIPWLITRRTYMKNQNLRIAERLKTEQELRHEALEKLKKTTELATLMELNQGQIDTYHRIVTQQADKSFRSSRLAMNIGMLLLVCAAFAVAYVPLDQVRWFIGALAAFSTVLSGYLTKTYLAMYKESIGQLNRYFDQPVLNSFYLTAERLTAGLDSEHAQDVRCQIINEVLATSARRGSRVAEPDEAAPKPPRPKKRATRKRTSTVNGTPQA